MKCCRKRQVFFILFFRVLKTKQTIKNATATPAISAQELRNIPQFYYQDYVNDYMVRGRKANKKKEPIQTEPNIKLSRFLTFPLLPMFFFGVSRFNCGIEAVPIFRLYRLAEMRKISAINILA